MRIIPRLDIKNENVIKGINFEGLRVEQAGEGRCNNSVFRYGRCGVSAKGGGAMIKASRCVMTCNDDGVSVSDAQVSHFTSARP